MRKSKAITVILPEVAPDIKSWATLVKLRDNWTCQKCGIYNISNHSRAHHIKSTIRNPELRLVIANGITLCIRCYQGTHGQSKHRPRKDCLKRLANNFDNKISLTEATKLTELAKNRLFTAIHTGVLEATKEKTANYGGARVIPIWMIEVKSLANYLKTYFPELKS